MAEYRQIRAREGRMGVWWSMTFKRSIAVFVLAASLSGGAAAQTTVALDDEIIFTAVEDALREARSLADARITVTSRDGYITLSGVADTVEDIATAGIIASRVRGVTGVANEIRVASRPWRAG